jgi:hypothetical protein
LSVGFSGKGRPVESGNPNAVLTGHRIPAFDDILNSTRRVKLMRETIGFPYAPD